MYRLSPTSKYSQPSGCGLAEVVIAHDMRASIRTYEKRSYKEAFLLLDRSQCCKEADHNSVSRWVLQFELHDRLPPVRQYDSHSGADEVVPYVFAKRGASKHLKTKIGYVSLLGGVIDP